MSTQFVTPPVNEFGGSLSDSATPGWFDRPQLVDRSKSKSPKLKQMGRKLLLMALAPDPERFLGLVTHPVAKRLDWDWIVDRAIAHKVSGLLAHRLLDDRYEATVSEDAWNKLAIWQDVSRQRARACEQTMRRVGAQLNEASISFVAVKGRCLSEQVYDLPEMRPSSDVDLLVRESQLEHAEAVLLDLGFQFTDRRIDEMGVSPERARAWRRARHRHWSYAAPDPLVDVELHWRLAESRVAKVSPDELWAATTEAEISGIAARTLDPEASLLQLCWHATEKGPFGARLVHFCDIAWFLANKREQLCDDRLIELARNWRQEATLLAAIQACQQLFRIRRRPYLKLMSRLRLSVRWFNDVSTPEHLVDQRTSEPSRWQVGRTIQRRVAMAKWDLSLRRMPTTAMDGATKAILNAAGRDIRRVFRR